MLNGLAASPSDRLLYDERIQRAATLIAMILTFAAIALLLWTSSSQFAETWRLTGYFADFLAQAREGAVITLATAVGLTLILSVRRHVSPKIWVALLSIFVLADLFPRVRGLTPRIDASYYDPPPVATQLRGARVYNDADWRLMLLGAGG